MNWYRGVSSERSFDGASRLENVSNGYTAEYGTSFKNARWARVYMEAYRWQLRRSEDKHGLRIGTELQLTPRISVDMGYNKPEHKHGSPYGKIMFRLAGVDTAWFGGNHRSDTKHRFVRICWKMCVANIRYTLIDRLIYIYIYIFIILIKVA